MSMETRYLGLALDHPVVASASPLSASVDGICALEDAGASAVVMPSLFEEQLRAEQAILERLTESVSEHYAESLSFFPSIGTYKASSDEYLETLQAARERTDIPILASLNGVTPEGWTGHARELESAGASAIELNVYYLPTDLGETGAEVESRYAQVVHAVKSAVSIPVAIKVGPQFSAFGHTAKSLTAAGADSIVMFNRFYRPDFDIETLEASRELSLSSAAEIRLGLFWLALLYGNVDASLAASSGVETYEQVVKYLLAGADVVMTTSALLRHGPGHLTGLRDGLADWMARHGFGAVGELRGLMSLDRIADPAAFERANYIQLLEEYDTTTA